MKKLLILALLLSTTACAQWGEFGYRDPGQDSIWYSYILIRERNDSGGIYMNNPSNYQLVFDGVPAGHGAELWSTGNVYVGKLGRNDGKIVFKNSTNDGWVGIQAPSAVNGEWQNMVLPAAGDNKYIMLSEYDGTKGRIPFIRDGANTTNLSYRHDSRFSYDSSTATLSSRNINVTGYLQTSADTLVGILASAANVDFGNYSIVKIDVNDNAGISGITGGVDGRRITLVNLCEDAGIYYTLTFNHQTESTPSNRIITTSGTDDVLQYGESADFVYDGTASRWREVGRTHTHAYGGLWADTSGITVTLTSKDTFYKLKHLRHDQQPVSNVTCTDSNMTILASGNYMITCNAAFSGSANIVSYAKAYLNGVAADWLEFERKLNATGDVGSAGFSGIMYMPAGYVLDFRIANDSDSKSVSIRHFNFSIHKIN